LAADSALAPGTSAEATQAAPAPSASRVKPTEAALTSALRATPITMFTTDWCPVCQRARAFLTENGMTFTERDIDRDERARDELKRRTGKSSIPTIEVDGKLLEPGFSEGAVMAAVAASVKRRLGVDAVEVKSR
jgi:glutaredoxin 3